jgi:class 3 adenylate cyclase
VAVECASCGTENRPGRKFCADCGAPLAVLCPACGASNEPGERFCGDCGGALEDVAAAAPPPPLAAERRLVSVLFADLVGFTPLAESRDAEEVRELLSHYFDTCRRLVELDGGTVEKFIGDAVMAVWGAPVAQEDDAERAVRTALDLVAAVSALGDEVGAPELRARAGVLTGEAAVTLGAVGEGMVAGDLVNTAARIQAEAAPGTVLVGEATRRASEAAVVFEDAGARELKGKAEGVRLYRAVRVAAARGGALRSSGLEAPFVGRQRELRLVKELFHAAAEQSRAQLVTISGIGGIGKSRLAWEFFKYIDGLAESIWWHRGRCLAYGEGVAYWALAEMVRTRAGIQEDEAQAVARTKLAACLAEHVPNEEERSWVEPRLANLLGLEERVDADRQDLFAAWRLFFERLADARPVVLVFEDLQWADQALLAFVEYLLEWSSSQRIYVLALARPELAEHSPEFARGVRNAASLALEPLSDEAMAELLDGYVPGLPAELRAQVLGRAQGVPLYAVETVRMLLDRGLLVEEGSVYRPTGEIGTLEIPETLHALVAARLDGLTPEERRLVQNAAVLGKSFTKAALSALTGAAEPELESVLTGLVRKEVLSLQADARMPEQGQYGFLQELLRQVAYETLSRRDRKTLHLAAVAALVQSMPGAEQDVPEVLAVHLLAAHGAAPDDPDAAEIRVRARGALAQAAERAAALAAPEEGQRHLDHAAALAEDEPATRARLLGRAGRLAFQAGDHLGARERIEQAIAIFEELDDVHAAVDAGVALADVDVSEGRLDEGLQRLETARVALEQSEPGEALAATLASAGRIRALRGERASLPILEQALALAEELALDMVFVQALTSKAIYLMYAGRPAEAEILLEALLARLGIDDPGGTWWRVANNLASLLIDRDRYVESLDVTRALLEHARQRGDNERVVSVTAQEILPLIELGRWDEALARIAQASELRASPWARAPALDAVSMLGARGDLAAAEALVRENEWARDAEQADLIATFAAAEAALLRAQGRPADASVSAARGLAVREEVGIANAWVKHCLVEAVEASLAGDDLERADELLTSVEGLKPGDVSPHLDGHRARLRAQLEARNGGERVDELFRHAERVFGESAVPFHLAVAQLEHAEWLLAQPHPADAHILLAEARATFQRLEAAPWLARVEAAAEAQASTV